MSASRVESGACRVIGGDKLPADTGGAQSLCAMVEQAIARRAPNVRYSAELTVVSRAGLRAKLTVEGHGLPEQSFHVSDRDLNPQSIGRFAQAIADEVAKAGR